MVSRTLFIRSLMALAALASSVVVEAWSPNQKIFGSPTRTLRRKTSTTPPAPIVTSSTMNDPTASSSSRTVLKYTKSSNYNKIKNPHQERSTKTKLSNSVLASCDTLPSFRTAHGLLSPETVKRLQESMTVSPTAQRKNQALATFLTTYRKHGPLSCVPMLSDPDVLPHLTLAMRDIAL